LVVGVLVAAQERMVLLVVVEGRRAEKEKRMVRPLSTT
jgi:hypothetical protein